MNRNLLEKITASLVVFLTTAFALGLILIIANLTFEWDIFPPYMEKVLYFLASSFVVLIMAATLINIMLNISKLAFFAEQITKFLVKDDKKH